MAEEEAKKATPAKDVAEVKAVLPPPPGAKDKKPPADHCKALVIVESE